MYYSTLIADCTYQRNEKKDIEIGSVWRQVASINLKDVDRSVQVIDIIGTYIGYVYTDELEFKSHHVAKPTYVSSSTFLHCFKRTPIRPGTIWYHTNGGVHIAITIKEENRKVWFVSSDNKACDLCWAMPFEEWIKTYQMYDGIKPQCFPGRSFDEILEETKGRYERVMEGLKEEKIEANKKETYLNTDKSKMKEFSSGAKREDKTGKGRYDLIPGDVMNEFEDFVWEAYFKNGTTTCSPTDVSKSAYFDDWTNVELYYDFMFNVISLFFVPSIDREECEDDSGEISYEITWDGFRAGLYEMRNALAKHYEAGAVVHGVDNWKKGLPVYGSDRGGCFLDSMRRHTDQALQGKDDEPHAVAALWNAFCAVWTLKNKPTSAVNPSETKPEAEAKSKDREAEYLTLPSGRKIKIEFLRSRTDDEKDNAFLTALLRDKHTAGDIIKSLKRVNDAGDASKNMKSDEAPDKIADAPTVPYSVLAANVDNCIELLSKMLVDNGSIDLKFETHEAYINLYMICVLLKSVLCWFQENDKARVCIEDLISGIYDLINTNRRIFDNVKAKWVEGYDEIYAVCLGNPDKYRVLGMIDLCCRTGMKLMNDDHFCGRTVSNGILFELKEHLSKLIKE